MRTNSTRQPLILGLLIGILLGAVVVLHGLEILPGGYKYAAFAISVSIFLVALLFLLAIYYRDRIIQKLFGDVDNVDSVLEESQQFTATIAGAVTDLALKGTNLTPEAKERAKAFAPRAASFILWRNVRNWWFRVLVAIIVAIGGLATTILLVNQNKLLETQNEKIEIQTSLMEAQRRSALVLLMSNILSDVKEEIKEQRERAEKVSNDSLGRLEEKGFALSEPLIGRIAALSQGFLPYRILQRDTLIKKEYSVERGQLLLLLWNSQLNVATLNSICKQVIFDNSYLSHASLAEPVIRKARLHGANLDSIQVHKADFRGSDFTYANLSRADLTDAKLHYADLAHAIFNKTDLSEAILKETDLSFANLREAFCIRANFRDATLEGADMTLCNLTAAQNLTKAQLLSTRCLYQTKGIDQWKAELEKEKPCLFTEQGCPLKQ